MAEGYGLAGPDIRTDLSTYSGQPLRFSFEGREGRSVALCFIPPQGIVYTFRGKSRKGVIVGTGDLSTHFQGSEREGYTCEATVFRQLLEERL